MKNKKSLAKSTGKFTHLHVHTEYSLLDGLSKTSKLIAHVKENGMSEIAVTDHGAMYGIVEFYKKAIKEGVKPILGMEGYVVNVDHKLRPERGKVQNFHQLLLAKDNEGYKNLMKLTSIAHIEGYYYRPRFDKDTLAKYAKGLICTSTCIQGELPQAILAGSLKEAERIVKWYLDVFGKDYYLEVQRHNYDKFAKSLTDTELKKNLLEMAENEKTVNEAILKLSRSLGVPIVATNDAHYVKKQDATAQDALVCVATGKNVSDGKRIRFIDSPTFYVTTPEEMYDLFSDLPEACQNTSKIADKCDVSLTLDKWFFPKYPVKGKTHDEALKEMAKEGIRQKLQELTPEIKKRLEYELDTIAAKGYSTYFLIVSDMARWATEHGIITNTRGSAAGSLVSYAIGIININPLTYELPFERFLTPWRPSPPDIDLDIADDRREEIVNYLTEKYGKDKVAQICTFGRMMSRASVRDIARVLGYPYAVGDKIAKLVPMPLQSVSMSIDKALEESKDFKGLYDADSDAQKIIDLAKQVEGNARHVSIHAAGIVIAPEDITNYTPIQLDPEGKKIITQYDMEALDPNVSSEAIGLLKFDLLGLRNLSILGAAIDIVEKSKGIEIEISKIPLHDKKTFEMLTRGDTMGVFQLSGSGMTKYLKELKPTRVEDLMAMVALYRPGPITQIPEYIRRKNNPDLINFIDPRMKEYLGKSYGLLVYQDDVFMTAIKLAGYTWEEADKFRKAIGKKIPEELEKQKQKFLDGCVAGGLSEAKAQEIFKLIEPFSRYGFNKSHAASYGMLAYRTGYMKANYPVEYMTALLTAESKDVEKVSAGIHECRHMGIKVLPPDINESEVNFTIVEDKESLGGKAIRFGLSAIKNVGKAAIEAILLARNDGKFSSFPDFCSRVDSRKVNKKVLESLIKVGGLSRFGTRAALLSSLDEIRSRFRAKVNTGGQEDLFSEEELRGASGLAANVLVPDIPEFSDDELQSLERQLLGLSLSAKPINELLGALVSYSTHKINEISLDHSLPESIRIAGVITEIRSVITKKTGAEMAFIKIEDGTGSINAVIFPKAFQSFRNFLIDFKPVLVSGHVDTRGDELSVLVDDLQVPETISENSFALQIRVPKDVTPDSLKKLKEILLSQPGSQKVRLIFEGEKDKIIDLPFGITWSEPLSHLIANCLDALKTS